MEEEYTELKNQTSRYYDEIRIIVNQTGVNMNGNVGIGTTSPAVLLHLENSNSTYTSPANTNDPTLASLVH